MAVLYSIRDWDQHFECAQSRKVKRDLTWVGIPCKHDGKSFRRLMMMTNGLTIYGAWILIVQIAAKCPTRGVLADPDGPLTTEDLAIKTGCPIEFFEHALKVLTDKAIGWISVRQWEGNGSVLPPPTNQTDRPTEPTNQPPYPPTQASPAPNADPQAGGVVGRSSLEMTWGAVERRLGSIGVVQWKQASQNAQANGCSPQLAHQLLDFAQQYGKGPGAIAKRFAIASPTLGLNTGWINTDRPETKEQRRVQSAADKRAQRAAEDAEQSAWRLVKAGRDAGKSDEEIKAECEAASLPWVNPARVEKPKASRV